MDKPLLHVVLPSPNRGFFFASAFAYKARAKGNRHHCCWHDRAGGYSLFRGIPYCQRIKRVGHRLPSHPSRPADLKILRYNMQKTNPVCNMPNKRESYVATCQNMKILCRKRACRKAQTLTGMRRACYIACRIDQTKGETYVRRWGEKWI